MIVILTGAKDLLFAYAHPTGQCICYNPRVSPRI